MTNNTRSYLTAALLPPKGAAIPYVVPASRLTGKDDPMYQAAIELVRKMQKASISIVQRHLRISYNRAAYLVEAMEGTVVSTPDASGIRLLLPEPAAGQDLSREQK